MIDSFDEAVTCAEEALSDPGGLRFTHLPGLVRFVDMVTVSDLRPHGAAEFESAVRLGRELLYLGLRDEARQVFHLLADTCLDKLELPETVRSARLVAALGASLGRLDKAREVLWAVREAETPNPYDRAAVLANLAAVELARNDVSAAGDYARRARTVVDLCAPQEQLVLRELLATIEVHLSREPGAALHSRRVAYDELSASTWALLEDGDEDSPQAFLAVVTVAMARVESAVEDGDAPSLDKAVVALEVAGQRLAALLGADHPSALGVQADLAAAQLELARFVRSSARLLRAVGALESVTERLAFRLGRTHPRTVVALANLVIAQVESVRAVTRLVASLAARPRLALGEGEQGTGGDLLLLTRRETPGDWATAARTMSRWNRRWSRVQ
ncbi:hypothetical protein [Streptomyces sp. Agncl-13]|uniref:hypothetical protein n=1 Tax=Streptomyces sp. Agncl-13 TaxID=3400628 RepID=UPI003A8A74A9